MPAAGTEQLYEKRIGYIGFEGAVIVPLEILRCAIPGVMTEGFRYFLLA